MLSKAEGIAQCLQLLLQEFQSSGTQSFQADFSHFCRDERVSITITTHTVSKTQPRKVIGIVQQGWIKPNLSPGLTETLIQGRQYIGEDVTQVVQDVVEFLLQSSLFKVDLTGTPE